MNIKYLYGKEQQQLKTTTLYLQFKQTLFVINIIKDNVIKTIQQGRKKSLSIIIFVLIVGYIFILLFCLVKTDIAHIQARAVNAATKLSTQYSTFCTTACQRCLKLVLIQI